MERGEGHRDSERPKREHPEYRSEGEHPERESWEKREREAYENLRRSNWEHRMEKALKNLDGLAWEIKKSKAQERLRKELERESEDSLNEKPTNTDPCDIERINCDINNLRESSPNEADLDEEPRKLHDKLGVDGAGRRLCASANEPEFLADRLKEIEPEAAHSERDHPEVSDHKRKYGKTEVSMYSPEVRGTPIDSMDELRDIVDNDYPGLKTNKAFGKWMKQAEQNMELYQKHRDNPELGGRDMKQHARDIGANRNAAWKWIHSDTPPNIYKYLKEAMTKEEGRELAERLRGNLEGVRNMKDLRKRLDSFYLKKELEQRKAHTKYLEQSRRFFKYLRAMEKGGLHNDMARAAGASRKTAEHWRDGERPRYVRIAVDVPHAPPSRGHKWLPTRLEGKSFKDFIEVPKKVRKWEDVQSVLDQLKPLDTPRMKHLEKRFGAISDAEAFGYISGLVASDAGFNRHGVNERLALSLSKKYGWSEAVGEAMCHSLGKFGIDARRVSDRTKEYVWKGERHETHYANWTSNSSPVLNWMKRSAMNYDVPSSKRPLDAPWMLKAPEDFRKAFIQGAADGDGWATTDRFGISTNDNASFYKKMMTTLGIESRASSERVESSRNDSIQQAASLPFFRHAFGRQEKLEELSDMSRAGKDAGFTSQEERELIRSLHKEGLSSSEIRQQIWRKMGIARSTVAIWRITRDFVPSSLTDIDNCV